MQNAASDQGLHYTALIIEIQKIVTLKTNQTLPL